MKKYISISILLILLFFGCSDQTNLTGPIESPSAISEPKWISLPAVNGDGNGLSINSMPVFEASRLIKGKNGGKIKINEKYNDGPLGQVKVKAQLEFIKGAFEGEKYITMKLDSEFGEATFSPHLEFAVDAVYNAEFTGLDLTGIDPESINFVYQAADGSYEYIDHSKLEIDVKKGQLKVVDAKLPHFSRYGFVN
jgi:hypothetical protein